jgi:RNA polymerase sigma factor (sigma-70 family)
MDEPSDADLVVLARSDDTEAFRLLIERYQAMAFSIALHLVLQPETAQDLVQEAMLQAYLSLDQLRDVTRFKNWFYGIVLNVCRNWRRRQNIPPLSLDLLNICEQGQRIVDSVNPFEMVEEDELRCALQHAVQALSAKTRLVMVLYYYEDLSLEEIAHRLHLSLVAVKSRLHQGRKQLQKQFMRIYPELVYTTVSKQRRTMMTQVRIAKVVLPAAIPRVLVVLLDQAKQRILPLWLTPPDGPSLVEVDRRASHASQTQSPVELPAIDFAANLLRAAGATIQSVRVEELQDQLFYARVLVHGHNADKEVKARLGDALALAHREGSPIAVEDSLMTRLGMELPIAESETLDQQLDQAIEILLRKAGVPRTSQHPEAPRIKEPQNLHFTEGLQRWDLRGNFLYDMSGSHWRDYVSGTETVGPQPGMVSGYLKAQVPKPPGFADLRQAILADDYQGKRVSVSADIKIADVEQQAGLYLRVVDPARSKRPEERQQVTLHGSQGWTRYETQCEVPQDSVYILFGISLTGKGQVWVTNFQLESMQPASL